MCKRCGSHYTETTSTTLKVHKKSAWIIDVPETIEAGSKHIECTVCCETLETIEILKSDEDGNSVVDIIITAYLSQTRTFVTFRTSLI